IAFRFETLAPSFRTVGTGDDEGAGPVRERMSCRVSDQRRRDHGLSGTIDPALGVDERVDSARRLAPANIALAEIHRRPIEIEHGEVAIRAVGCQDFGSERLAAIRERSRKADVAIAVALSSGQDFVAPGYELHSDALQRLGVLQRTYGRGQAITTRVRCKSQVGDDQPSFRLRAPPDWFTRRVDLFELDEVGARLQPRYGLRDGKDGRGGDVRRSASIDGTGPKRLLHIGGIGVLLQVRDCPGRRGKATRERPECQRPIGNAGDDDLDLVDVDGLDRKAVGIDTRQDYAIAFEADIGRAVAEFDGDRFVGDERAAIGGRQPRAKGDVTRLTEGKAAKAQVRSLYRERDPRLRYDRD